MGNEGADAPGPGEGDTSLGDVFMGTDGVGGITGIGIWGSIGSGRVGFGASRCGGLLIVRIIQMGGRNALSLCFPQTVALDQVSF